MLGGKKSHTHLNLTAFKPTFNLRKVLLISLCYDFAWISPGYDIKRPGKYWFLTKFGPGF